MPTAAAPLTLAPGDLITADYQYEYNSLLLGHGTSYIMEKVSGLLSHPAIVENHQKREDRHGIAYGFETFDARRIAFDVAIEASVGSSSGALVESYLDTLHDAFQMSSAYAASLPTPIAQAAVDLPFIFQRPNKAKRVCYAHPSKLEFDSTGDVATGLAKGSIEMLCGDPRVYSLASSTLASNIPSGASVSPTLVVANNGNFPSPRVTLSFTGPGTNPTITNTTLGRAIRLSGTLSAADIVTIDLNLRTIKLNGANAYYLKRADNQWWELAKGNNSIVFSRAGTDAVNAPVSITWQSAWSTA